MKQRERTKPLKNKGQPNKSSLIKEDVLTSFGLTLQHCYFLFTCIFITLLCYLPAFTNGWTNYDDNGYVELNNLTKHLSFSTLPQFVTTYHMGNYHPFAMLSLAMDFKFFGMNATGFHTHSIFLHLVNVVLVFLFVWSLTRKLWAATITSLFFGIHPSHIESVAWISERKDLLYVLYYLAALIFYLRFLQAGRKTYLYILTLALFIFSLFSKGQAVTLPITLFLVDYYLKRPFNSKLLLEKLPFFLLSIFFGIIAVVAQQSAETLTRVSYPLTDRFLFSCSSLLTYFYKALVPLPLSAFYSYPFTVNGHYEWTILIAPVIVVVMAGLVVYSMKFGRTIAFGFAFFLINVMLVLQFFPVGSAMMADRYTYLSYIGLFFILGIGIQQIADNTDAKISKMKIPAGLLALSCILFFGIKTFDRIHIWKGNESLFLEMLSHNPNIPGANNNLGLEYQKQGKNDLALSYFNKAIQLKPDYFDAYLNRGNLYYMLEKYDSALVDFDKVLKNDPVNIVVLNNYAYYLSEKGERLDDAARMALKALSTDTTSADYMDTYGWILYKQKKYSKAKLWTGKALLNGKENDGIVLEHYGDVLFQTGDTTGALHYWQKAKYNNVKSETIDEKIEDRAIK